MRTAEEIIEHCNSNNDVFGFTCEVLLPYLTAEQVAPFLKEGAIDDWTPTPLTVLQVVKEMQEYMEFAWEKVGDHRGLSASRNIIKMRAWLWLLGDDATLAHANVSYAPYGAPILKRICDVYGFPVPEDEAIKNMIQGKACTEGCEDCGR